MITNLIVLDKKHTFENGKPKEDGDIYSNKIVCHPLFKEKIRDALCKMDVMYEPIFVTSEEWTTMEIFSSLVSKESNNMAKEVHKSLYQQWWNKILSRARKEQNGYINSIQKSQRPEASTVSS